VVVTISKATPVAGRTKLMAAAKRYGQQIRVNGSPKHQGSSFGGDAINNGQVRCSDGFNVRRNGQLMS